MEDLQDAINEAFTGQEEDILILLNTWDTDELFSYVQDNPIVFLDVCKKGFLRAALALISFGADVNTEWGGVTALQDAATSGDVELVKFLLDNGAKVSREVWLEDSPFYLASLHGHYHVIEELTTAYPSLVKCHDSRTSLFYAACKGGNLDIVKFWYLPGMDINSPVQLISSFENCENMVPIYAACQTNQLEVAQFLVSNEAILTGNVCRHFPEMTSQLVENCFQENSYEMYTADLNNICLSFIPALWFEPYLHLLTVVNLSGNKLKTIPSVLPWDMPNLQFLNLSKNKLETFKGPTEEQGICERLEVLNLSENCLEALCPELFCLPALTSLDISDNQLQYLMRSSHFQPELSWAGKTSERVLPSGGGEWNLPCLTHLYAQRNRLVMVPEQLRTCHAVRHLDFSDNSLFSFLSPWNCPLCSLDLSDNMLERFPVSVEEFWSGSLIKLFLQNNSIEEMGESIVKLSGLQNLNMSNNKIENLPDPSLWDCRYLESLNLSNNNLGLPLSEEEINRTAHLAPRTLRNFITFRQRNNSDSGGSKTIEFPSILAMSLKLLNLRNNNLDSVPPSVCKLPNLTNLDISQNPLITTLPHELGMLTQCRDIVLAGTNIKDIPENILADSSTTELLEHLRQLHRKCEPQYDMKMIVLGPQDKGKSSLIGLLTGTHGYYHGNKIHITKWTLSARNAHQLVLPSKKPDIHFSIWELPGHPELSIIHQCFLTRNTLYLLVFDLRKDIQHLQDWLSIIQANAPRASVILVGTFYDKLEPSSRDATLKEIGLNIFRTFTNQRVSDTYLNIQFIKPVSCATKDGINDLKKIIYDTASGMKNIHKNLNMVIGTKIPRSYKLLVKKVSEKRKALEEKKEPPILTEEDFNTLLEELPEITVLDDVQNAVQYLLETGCLLHFNEQLQGLNSLYFLDPVYLQDMLSIIAFIDKGQAVSSAKIPIKKLHTSFKGKSFPDYLFPQFLQLLSCFEIAVSIDNDKSLLVPSKLPREKPMIHPPINEQERSRKISRLYKMPYIPLGLWNRFIVRLMKATERFAQTPWYLNRNTPDSKRSSEISRRSSSRGLALKNHSITYWREGIRVAYQSSYFLVESVNYHHSESEDLGIGILITIVSPDNNGLSAMGIIVDELDDIIRDYFPGFQECTDQLPQVFAVCPQCTDPVKKDSGNVVNVEHFDVQTCALAILKKESITCPRGGKIPLEEVVPEMLFKELPKRFFLDPKDITISDKSLGIGAAGSVYRGKFRELDIAIKAFHCSISAPNRADSVDSGSGSMSTQDGQDTMYKNVSADWSLDDEANSVKAYKAFSDVRKEVAVLSKLRHPCIISFLGLCVHPELYIVMELAPLGSLRDVLNDATKDRKFNKFTDQLKTFGTVLSKYLTFKIVYQVAKGLQYLHENSITYRDLKSDNVLVCTLDVEESVNVKLSDYGISKFSTTQGLSGFVGTPGYMAPEILNRHTYTQQVDIFSFSMLVHEVLCGHVPYKEYINLMQIIQAVVKEKKRPNIKDFQIVSHFPYLEHLMRVCWEHDAHKRPTTERICQYMRHIQFVCQHEALTVPQEGAVFSDVTSISLICETDWGSNVRQQLWMWESANEDRERCYSIYNLDTASFHVFRNACRGADVKCMLKVGKYMWVGTMIKEIEVFGCHSVGVPQCKESLSLTAVPTIMVFLKLSDNEEEQMGHVFVGLDNGTLAIFSHQPLMRKLSKLWRLAKTLTFSDTPVTAMTLAIDDSELWVGCGHTVMIVCTQTLLKEDSINIKDLNIAQKLKKSMILHQMVSHGTNVWCSFRNSSKIIEFNGETRTVTHCLDVGCDKFKSFSFDDEVFDSDFKSDSEEEVPVPTRPPTVPARSSRSLSDERGRNDYLSLLPEPVGEQRKRYPSDPTLTERIEEPSPKGSSDAIPCDERQYDEPVGVSASKSPTAPSDDYEPVEFCRKESTCPPPRPEKLKKQGKGSLCPPPLPVRKSAGSMSLPGDLIDSAPPLPPRPMSTVRVGAKTIFRFPERGNTEVSKVRIVKGPNTPPPVPPRREVSSISRSISHGTGMNNISTGTLEDPPVLPPRRITIHGSVKQNQPSSLSTPVRTGIRPPDIRPPIQPPVKRSSTKVTSMLAVKDTLWIGTSKGTIVLVGFKGDKSRIRLTTFDRVSAVRLDNCPPKSGPVYMMSEGGDLVVSAVQTNSANETELIAWQSVGSEELKTIGHFWRQLSSDENELSKKNSIETTLSIGK